MSYKQITLATSITILLTACASLPNSPSVMVLPGTGLSFDQFRNDDAQCRQYAYLQISGSNSNQLPNNNAVGGAVVGTAVGAVTGAAIGGGTGAAIGAGSGLVAGGALGASSVDYGSYYADQQRYDTAFIQCMYSKGHQVPVMGQFTGATSQPYIPSQAPASPIDNTIPPPPPGTPPPPPVN